jgi:hypothetical protein
VEGGWTEIHFGPAARVVILHCGAHLGVRYLVVVGGLRRAIPVMCSGYHMARKG